ncbi:ARM repeat-containing protein [Punctularia strigosozonata HHB-11173 SS5]|uniref:ARM repeat-containing protein n=1 Tax=Punctularia strigosozonata (strain HHB-11173) TaxID=741275 RepID=UPI00044176F9|nr:ARM repeat-containing protein [Punctularia strigosozonata HHB-11173 SS5]EIN07478.1 ARM repeat-containing protein [Punctularia strigosozonata HHB-11173 SS5]
MYDDDTLNTLEKIWLFSRSEATFHRVFIVHSLPDFLDDVTPTEAVDYVLPLVSSLAMDEEDAVKEALAAELVRIAWWFLTHCQVVDYEPGEGTENPTLLPVQAFTPILGTLLLCPSPAVATSSRRAVVELLSEIRKADEGEVEPGLFGEEERHLFRQELLESVVVGMARLDVSDRPSSSHSDARGPALQTQPQTNPYFPDVPAAPAASTPASRSAPGSPTLARNAQGVGGERAQGIPTTVVTDTDPAMTGQARGGSPADVRMTPSEDPDDASEQAAMGRLSSMSLMAAVTASGSVDDDARAEFVGEVTRAGRDPVYWVRREASFALGALAKVVPFEIVTGSLLPLFEALCHDPTWHVRHSALFAFPAILSRLQPRERRSLAMGIVFSLSADPAPAVQSGVLEALGEVIHSFRDDPGGPPYDLLRLFLGRPEDREFWKNRIRSLGLSPQPQAPPSDPTSPFAGSGTAFFDDPARPLICAFNFPAVTLTLGRDRWHELRDFYATLARSEVVKVRRSLAASAGEIAKIVGPENARRDVLPMWFEAVRSEEADLRLRAVECLGTLAQSLGPTERADLLVSLQRIWVDNLRGWRERETVAGSLDELVPLMGEKPGILRSLLLKALQDSVAAVRQAAINMVPKFCVAFGNRPTVIRDIHEDINRLARAPSYRYRMTFVACRQALVLAPGGESTLADSHFWKLIGQLADDQITNVRIGVARLLGIICDRFFSDASKMPSHIMDILVRVAHDESKEVQSYVSVHWDRPRNPVPSDLATFSRPPPTPSVTSAADA